MCGIPSDALIDELRALVAGQTGRPLAEVTAETTLYSDLGVDGDDAGELLSAVAQRWNVSFDGFVFHDHFDGEGVDALTPIVVGVFRALWPRFRVLWREALANEREITIAHLALCASLGHWVPSPLRRDQGRQTRLWRRALGGLLICVLIAGQLGLAAFTLGCLWIAYDRALAGEQVAALTWAVPGLMMIGLWFLFGATTVRYLRGKEVWRRISPLAG